MSETKFTQGDWKYGVRNDQSIWVSLGDQKKGPHYQFDWHAPKADAAMAMAATDMYAALLAARNTIAGMGSPYIAASICDAALAKARGES